MDSEVQVDNQKQNDKNSKVNPTVQCRLTFDKRFTYNDLKLETNVTPLVSVLLPYISSTTYLDTLLLYNEILTYVFNFSSDNILLEKLIKLFEDHLKLNGELDFNEFQMAFRNMRYRSFDFVIRPYKKDKTQSLKGEALILFIFHNINDKDLLLNEIKMLFNYKKIQYNIPIKKFILRNGKWKENDWKIIYGFIILKCFLDISHVDIINLPTSITNKSNDFNLFIQLLSIITNIDSLTIKQQYFGDTPSIIDMTFNNAVFVQCGSENTRYFVDLVISYANRLQSELELKNSKTKKPFFSVPGFKSQKIENIENTYDLKSFNVSDYNITSVNNILTKRPYSNILIYGPPGVGKTEFVKSILKKINRNFIEFNPMFGMIGPSFNNETGGINPLILFVESIEDVQQYAKRENAIILIDECDALLNIKSFNREKTLSKIQLNNILDLQLSNNIWITNYIDGVDYSSLRRFDFVVKFDEMGDKQKNKIWHNALEEHKVHYTITNKEINTLIKKYNKLTPSNINRIVQNAALNDVGNKINFLYNVNEEAKNVYKNIFNIDNIKNINKKYTVKRYNLDTININYNPQDIINSVKAFSDNPFPEVALSLLFTGMPGTGKTEFAKYIAHSSGKELLIKKYSDLSDSYVGQTEKNIAKAFEEAKSGKKILLIDECDSIFQTRKNANHLWEVTQTNEFLTQLENYKGIIICTTNFIDNLDQASMRRFMYKIKFNPLSAAGRVIMYKKYFNKKTIPNEIENELNRMDNLCHGDYKTVYERMKALMTPFTNENIIKELNNELSFKEKNNSIGFFK